MEGGEGIPED